MADFFFSSAEGHKPEKLTRIYSRSVAVNGKLSLFSNYAFESYSAGDNSAYIIGTAQVLDEDKAPFFETLLEEFTERSLPLLQQKLTGQYVIVISANGKVFILPDFLNVKTVFFDRNNKEASSRPGALSSFREGFIDGYKSFEAKAMGKSLYPVTLGSDTAWSPIERLQPCQYLVVGEDSGEEITVKDFTIDIDNVKRQSAGECARDNHKLLRAITGKYSSLKSVSTITGGYDSRLVSAICASVIPNLELRIGAVREEDFQDLKIARRVAGRLGKKLNVYKTEPDSVREEFMDMTDGQCSEDNIVIFEMARHSGDYDIGFGGTFGTELYSTLRYTDKESLMEAFLNTARKSMQASESMLQTFRKSMEDQFEYLESHLVLKERDPRDAVRLFMVFMTSRFSSPLLSLSDVYGHQMEPLATFPVIRNGLQIPYRFQGDTKSYGRFYLIPKMIMKRISIRAGAVRSTHSSPLLPLSVFTFPIYVFQKLAFDFCHRRK